MSWDSEVIEILKVHVVHSVILVSPRQTQNTTFLEGGGQSYTGMIPGLMCAFCGLGVFN